MSWAVLASLVLLEVVLQIGSVVVWWLQRAPAPTMAAGTEVLLCVGDSWTHGMGSTDTSTRSYPAVVQERVRSSTGKPWTVVNCGLTGQNSREVLERLPAQLAEFRPKLVCVLVGQNDFWSRPQPLLVDPRAPIVDHRSYRFRWRLPRLLAWVAGKFTGAGQAGSTPRATRTGAAWQARPVANDNPYWRTEASPWPWHAEANDLMQAGWRLEAKKDYQGACDSFTKALALSPDNAQCRQALAGLHRRLGREAEALVQLDWLRAFHAKSNSFWSGSSLATALDACGQWPEALLVLRPLVERFPADGSLWRLRAQTEFFLGHVDDAERSIARAMQCWPDPWNYQVCYKIKFLGRKDTKAATAVLFAGYVAFNDAKFVSDWLLGYSAPALVHEAREVALGFDCPPDVKERLVTIVDDVLAEMQGNAAQATLSGHLQRIVAAVRSAGAVPLLLSYPVPQEAAKVLRRVATDQEVQFVDVEAAVQARLGSRPIQELLATDGHCNDEGYRWMAEIVAAALLPLLEQKK